MQTRVADKLNPGFVLDPAKIEPQGGAKLPNIIVVAANARGEIVRYFETGETAAYFGSPYARDKVTGRYLPAQEPRRIASTGKMIIAIAVAPATRTATDPKRSPIRWRRRPDSTAAARATVQRPAAGVRSSRSPVRSTGRWRCARRTLVRRAFAG